MRAFVLMTALALATGCTSAIDALDEIFLSPNEADALVVNFEASVDAQQELSELVFAATRGDLDLVNDFANVDYVPPSELNNWTGSLTITDGVYLLKYLFAGGDPPKAPYPDPGTDPTDDTLACPAM